MEFFRAPYDRLTVTITVLGTGVLIGAGLLVLLLPLPTPSFSRAVGVSVLGILFLTYLYSPRGYSLGPDGLRIHRPIGPHVVPRAAIRSARRAAPRELCGLRTFGSGGLFGFFGWFYARKFGHYRAYVTSRQNLVLVEAERVYLLSPERPDEFLRRLADWVPGLSTGKA